MGEQDEARFFEQVVENQRLVVRLRVRRVYGVVRAAPPGGRSAGVAATHAWRGVGLRPLAGSGNRWTI